MDRRALREMERQFMHLAQGDPNPEYGCKIVWHEFWRKRRMVHVSGLDRNAVSCAAIGMAKQSGWSPPKWWQFWRWDDTRIDEA